jgi:hypothetical protein
MQAREDAKGCLLVQRRHVRREGGRMTDAENPTALLEEADKMNAVYLHSYVEGMWAMYRGRG